MHLEGSLFIISAPSGGGKTSLVNALIERLSGICLSISHTTRPPRHAETEGVNYFFVDEAQFQSHEQQGYFLEHAKVFNHWYGTSKAWVEEKLKKGIDVILEIDWQGALSVKAKIKSAVMVFIIPPSRESLLTRLRERQQDSQEVIDVRMARASDEISHYTAYDFLVVNDKFDDALGDLEAIIRAERLRLQRQQVCYEKELSSLLMQ